MGMGNAFRKRQHNLRRRIFSGRLSPRKGNMNCFHHVKEYPWFIRRRRGVKTTVFVRDFWTTISWCCWFSSKFIWATLKLAFDDFDILLLMLIVTAIVSYSRSGSDDGARSVTIQIQKNSVVVYNLYNHISDSTV